jgi:hypothetical protein
LVERTTGSTNWQPPAAAPSTPASPWASPAPTGQPAAAPAPAPFQPPAGWTPPPKPGLIPLRPLSFGTIIGSSFRVMRRNPAPTFGLSVLLYGLITIVFVAVIGAVFAFSFSRVDSALDEDQFDIVAGSLGLIMLSFLVPVGLSVIATSILQGIISLEVARATIGERLTVRGLFRLARGKLGALVGWSMLLTAAVVVYLVIATVASLAVFAVFGAGIASTGSQTGDMLGAVLVAMLLTFLVGLAFSVLAAWLGTKLALVPSVIMLERATLGVAMARSFSLTRGFFWKTFGVQALIVVIVNTAANIVSIPVSFIGTIVMTLVNPLGDSETLIVTVVIMYLVLGVMAVFVGAVGLVMQSASTALIYIDIRMRKEGLDLELISWVESASAGARPAENPYDLHQARRAQQQAPAAASGSPWA